MTTKNSFIDEAIHVIERELTDCGAQPDLARRAASAIGSKLLSVGVLEAKPEFGNQKVVSRLYGLSEAWMERDRWSGPLLPFFKIGSKVMYRLADVEAFLESRKVV